MIDIEIILKIKNYTKFLISVMIVISTRFSSCKLPNFFFEFLKSC